MHNGKGVKLTRVQEYFPEYTQLTQIKWFVGSYLERMNVVRAALAKLGKPYDLINYNCEHFVNDVLSKKPSSSQIANLFGLLGFALVVRLSIKEKI